MKEILKTLSETHAISGFEKRIRPVIKEMLQDHVDSVEVDALGNLICKKGSGKPVYLLNAHMDEIGFIIKHIDDEGYLRFVPIGGHWNQFTLNQRVIVYTKDRMFKGTVQCKSPAVMDKDEAEKVVKWQDMFIDIGASSKEEVEKLGVKISDQVTPDEPFAELSGDNLMGKAFDNRTGCAVLVQVMKELKKFKGTVYCVFTSQEEVGLKGAKVAAHKIDPDYVISVDIGLAHSAMVNKWDIAVEIGKGPAIQHIEAAGRGLIANPKLLKVFKESAAKHKIPLQLDMTTGGVGGMTDAAVMQTTREGYPAVSISIPTKYYHTANQVCNLKDLENCKNLILKVVEDGINGVSS